MGKKLWVCSLVILIGCGGATQTLDRMGSITDEPDFLTVQHILIGFKGSVPDKDVTRSEEEAKRLAEALFIRAKAGEDFDALVEEYTDDSSPGVYGMANHGQEADDARQIYARSAMAEAFGDVAFSLAVEEIGMTYYDPGRSKYGWHIIKRIM